MARMILVVAMLMAAGCAPSSSMPECNPQYAWVHLGDRPLKTHNDFDWFDAMLRKGQPIWDGYDALLKIDPQNTLARVRAAWAMEYFGPQDKGATTARTLFKELQKTHPADPDVLFLGLALTWDDLSTGRSVDRTGLEARIRAFAKNHPDYIGPHGVTAAVMLKSLESLPSARTGS